MINIQQQNFVTNIFQDGDNLNVLNAVVLLICYKQQWFIFVVAWIETTFNENTEGEFSLQTEDRVLLFHVVTRAS